MPLLDRARSNSMIAQSRVIRVVKSRHKYGSKADTEKDEGIQL